MNEDYILASYETYIASDKAIEHLYDADIFSEEERDEYTYKLYRDILDFMQSEIDKHCKETDETPEVEKALDKVRADTKTDIAKECKYLLACGMGKNKSLEHLIKILEKEQKND